MISVIRYFFILKALFIREFYSELVTKKLICFLGFENFIFEFYSFERNNIYFCRYLNMLNVFSSNVNSIKQVKKGLYKFLFLRGLKVKRNLAKISLFSPFEQLNFFSWSLKLYANSKLIIQVSLQNILYHKAKLKSAIKNFINLPVSKLIQYLNILIMDWSNTYNLTDFFYEFSIELDVYLYKLLWKWAKRRHPRRTSLWIYSRYWKFFLGKWKFFAFDFLTSETIFLTSHYINSKQAFNLPYSVSIFDWFNNKKIQMSFYNSIVLNTTGIFRFLYKKQKGICFFCKKTLTFSDLSTIRICDFKNGSKLFRNLVIAHKYCSY